MDFLTVQKISLNLETWVEKGSRLQRKKKKGNYFIETINYNLDAIRSGCEVLPSLPGLKSNFFKI